MDVGEQARTDVARNLQAVQRLKADMIGGVAALYDAMYSNDDPAVKGALAQVVISAFVLSKRLGISYTSLDEAIRKHLRTMAESGHEAEQWFGDCSELLHHMKSETG